jgi:hypothetical protein
MFQNIINFFRRLCNPKKANLENQVLDLNLFIPACCDCDIKLVSLYLDKPDLIKPDLIKEGIKISIEKNNLELLKLFFDKIDINKLLLDDFLKLSARNNNYSFCEYLVQKGANIVVGLRYTTSVNIKKMLYRYEQKSEIIN